MYRVSVKLIFVFVCLSLSAVGIRPAMSQDAVSMVKDLKGDVWHICAVDKTRVKATPMLEMKKGDRLEIGKGGGATVLYYYSEAEERYKEDSEIEVGQDNGIVHKGGLVSAGSSSGGGFIRIDSDLPVSLKSQEDFGAFTLRGTPPPPPGKYFDEINVRRYAVVIGVSSFKDKNIRPLKYADRDARSFYDFLVSPAGGSISPDNIRLLTNEDATLRNVKDALTNFLKQSVDEDIVLIYVASHGEPEADRPKNMYILTHDSEMDNLSATAYHMEDVNRDLKRYVAAKRLIFLADACHAGGIASGGFAAGSVSNPINNALSAVSTTSEGWAMVTASRSSEVSIESSKWGGGHGAFTFFLLNGLNGNADVAGNYNGIVTVAEAYDYLENKVKKATGNIQHPSIAGDFDNNLPLGFIQFDGADGGKKGAASGGADADGGAVVAESTGMLKLTSEEDNANIFINGHFAGKASSGEPFVKGLPVGSAKVVVKKKGMEEFEKTIYINPDEDSNVYVAMRSAGGTSGSAAAGRQTPDGGAASAPKESEQRRYVAPRIDEAALKSGIDSLIKELEEMRLKQLAAEGGGAVEKPKVVEDKRVEEIVQVTGVPISIKRFTANMKASSDQRNMDMLRLRVIDELVKVSGISIVERDLQYQEEILREQRLGGSILSDKMFRIELGKILGADFICFSRVFPDYDGNNLILRIEVVETATTLVDTVECSFDADDVSLANARSIAAKIKEKIARKRKL